MPGTFAKTPPTFLARDDWLTLLWSYFSRWVSIRGKHGAVICNKVDEFDREGNANSIWMAVLMKGSSVSRMLVSLRSFHFVATQWVILADG